LHSISLIFLHDRLSQIKADIRYLIVFAHAECALKFFLHMLSVQAEHTIKKMSAFAEHTLKMFTHAEHALKKCTLFSHAQSAQK
jgi:hypothetical protein